MVWVGSVSYRAFGSEEVETYEVGFKGGSRDRRARNLLDEAHTFYESRGAFAAQGAFGIYNEPRAFGLDLTLKY
ncbi:hypothetical protein [Phenylobacterium sp.]|jgi:hypothetical protein|uniref:hypothetical protein n=1 Tax=Phenylobacterium sp. TaxID=1871053 RepID=UPI0037C6CC4E